MENIKLPELGEGINSVEISDVLVKTGDKIQINDLLIVVETEKASMEIPTTSSGTINKIHINSGDIIKPGDNIISIDIDNKDISNVSKFDVEKNINNKSEITDDPIIEPSKSKTISTKSNFGKPVLASPSVRAFARELGCDLKKVSGTGNKRRITKEDVQKYIKKCLAEQDSNVKTNKPNLVTKLDFSKFGEIDVQPLNKIKTITGERLQQSWQAIPHVTQFDRCNITKLEQIRLEWKNNNQDETIKPSLVPFFVKIAAKLLYEMPLFNSSLDSDNNLILKKYYNIGVAVDTKDGLVVPVIKNVLNKSIFDIAKDLTLISNNARNKKLKPSDMEAGCITISSLGGIGGSYFTPIINPPEVAILGISKSVLEPYIINGKLEERNILPFSLSYDHRVIDGADAARFTTKFGEYISNIKKIT